MNKQLPLDSISKENKDLMHLPDDFFSAFKSAYYCFNAAPDTQLKIFKDLKTIELSDINNLNDKVNLKLKTHNVVVSKVNINILFTHGRAFNFESWEEFKRMNWDLNEETESCSLKWDFFLQLPGYELPQRHTLKVRICQGIRFNELFQLLVDSENDTEMYESLGDIVCKVDFINSVICNELLNIVDMWHKGLADIEIDTHIKFLKKHANWIGAIISILVLLACFLFLYVITKSALNYEVIDFSSKIFLSHAYSWLCMSFLFLYLANTLTKTFSKKITESLKSTDETSIFIITNMDNRKHEKSTKANNKIVKDIILKIVVSVIVNILIFTYDAIYNFIK